MPGFIVRARIIFSECYRIDPLELLSTVTRFTEALLRNNFDDLFRSRNAFHNLTGREVLYSNSLIHHAIAQSLAGGSNAHAAQICHQSHGLAALHRLGGD